MSLSKVRRLNVAVAICRRYHLSEDIVLILILILVYTLMILKRSDRFRWARIVVQKRKIQTTVNDKNKYKSKNHLLIYLFIYFQNNNNGKRETIYFIISISDKRLSSFFISLILSLFFYLILSYLSGTCTFFFADISGWNFLSSFGHF